MQCATQVDAITSTNPYVYDDRAKARMLLGSYAAAAEDFDTAELLFKVQRRQTGLGKARHD